MILILVKNLLRLGKEIDTRIMIMNNKRKRSLQKIERMKYNAVKNAVNECTFKPDIESSQAKVKNNRQVIFLYVQLSRKNKSIVNSEYEDFEKCTFKPNINKRKTPIKT